MNSFDTADAIIFAAILGTVGWLYTARLARNLARKQHTINIMLKGNFDSDLRESHVAISDYLQGNKAFPEIGSEEYKKIVPQLRLVLNHYEFIAAGVRRGDIDETLVIDAERGTILSAFENSEPHIYAVRTNRRNSAIYEHTEWLHMRWEKSPPKTRQRCWEWLKGSPRYGPRAKVRD